ncbi:MAG: hypothetical protein IH624_03250 [Phycisphaerae bacterium]|nr:hypothetical protein [Phycisphaerae bacterium]
MIDYPGLQKAFRPDWEGLVENIRGKDTPGRVFQAELFHDAEIMDTLVSRFDLDAGISRDDPNRDRKLLIAVNRFCGQDYVKAGLDIELTFHRSAVEDTAGLKRAGGREFQNSHTGPIMSWEDFERYSWPDMSAPHIAADLEWFQENLPDDMCIVGGLTGHFCEEVTWLMGYETFCYALFEQPDLVKAIADKLREFYVAMTRRYLEYDRIKLIWASDDMGFKTGLLFDKANMRRLVLDSHKTLAQLAHDAGRLYLLHSCGKLTEIMDDLVHDVKIDAKHSFEDTIEDVREVKHTYGRHIALIGGMDVDFLCRSSHDEIRKRTRDVVEKCLPGGRFCLGTGNTVANYIPVDNYLAMIDEARTCAG